VKVDDTGFFCGIEMAGDGIAVDGLKLFHENTQSRLKTKKGP